MSDEAQYAEIYRKTTADMDENIFSRARDAVDDLYEEWTHSLDMESPVVMADASTEEKAELVVAHLDCLHRILVELAGV